MSSSIFRIVEHNVPCQHIREYPAATANSQEAVLHLAVKQYIPLDNPNPQPGDVTILGGHANGFIKELYEPLWDEIYHRARQNGFRIRGIWVADVAQQGASGVLNENELGNDPGWMDHPRDLLHLVNTMRDQMPRPLIGIGHSMGGCHLVNLALMHPRLLTSLILLDPVMQRFASAPKGHPNAAQLSTFRRDIWPSKEVAAASFKKSPFYATWDPRVLDRWIEYGLRDLPTSLYPDKKGVTLTTTKHQEVFTFLRPSYDVDVASGQIDRSKYPDLDPTSPDTSPFYRPEPGNTLQQLPHLRPSAFYILGGTSSMSLPFMREEKMRMTGTGVGGSGGAKEGRVKELVLEGIGHLVAMEAVLECADASAEWIGNELKRWTASEEVFRKEWTAKGRLERVTIDEEWKKQIGEPSRGKKNGQKTSKL